MHCPPGASGCKAQAPVASGDGCDKSLAWRFTKEPLAKSKKPGDKPVKPRFATLDLPKACAAVLAAPAASEQSATFGTAYVAPESSQRRSPAMQRSSR